MVKKLYNQKVVSNGNFQEFLAAHRSNQVEGLELSNPIIRGGIQTEGLTPRRIDTTGTDYFVQLGDNIQDAINFVNSQGGGRITLSNGTHSPGADLTLYSGIYLVGQNTQDTIIDFGSAAYSIKVWGSNAYSTGTVSVTIGGTAVTGSGTTWTAAMVGRSIFLSGSWYPITAVTDTTHLTIGLNYARATLSGASYMIATTIDDVQMDHFTVQNATGAAVDMRYSNWTFEKEMQIISCGTGIYSNYASPHTIDTVRCVACGKSLDLNNTWDTVVEFCGSVITTVGAGFNFTNCSNISIFSNYIAGSATNGVSVTNGDNINFSANTSENNTAIGYEMVSGNTNIILVGNNASGNGSDGMKFTATSDRCVTRANVLEDNGGYGINIAASTCDKNSIRGNRYNNNTSGEYSDSGTDTETDVSSFATEFTAGEHLNAGESCYLNSSGKMVKGDASTSSMANIFVISKSSLSIDEKGSFLLNGEISNSSWAWTAGQSLYLHPSQSLDLELSSTQYASCADSASLSLTGDCTIECNIKLESLPTAITSTQAICAKYTAAGNQRSYMFALAYVDASNQRFNFTLSTDGTDANAEVIQSDTFANLSTATWYHVLVRFTAASSTVEFFIDATQSGADKTGTKTSIYNSTAAFYVGARGDLGESYFDGKLRNLRVWNDIRTNAEITEYMTANLVGTESNLQASWKFDGDYLDQTANNNDLTGSGTPVFAKDVPYGSGQLTSTLPTAPDSIQFCGAAVSATKILFLPR